MSNNIVVALLILFAIGVVAKTVPIWFECFTIAQEYYTIAQEIELKAIVKMFIANMQILSNLGQVLAVRFPKVFAVFLASFVSVFK